MSVDANTAVAGLLDGLTELRPLLTANAAQGERDRRVPDESIAALAHAGAFRLMVPRRYGGHEGTMRSLLDVASAVAQADGGTGWVVGLTGVCAWVTGLFTGRAQDDVFGANPDARLCGSLSPIGRGERDGDGWRVSGRWSYVSGSLHADWAVLGFTAAGAGEPGIALVPTAELMLLDTWHTAGMRASGSNTLTGEHVAVPAHRVLFGAARGEYATEFRDESAYRAAFFPMATLVLVGPLLGLGRAALDFVAGAAATKGIVATPFARQAESTGFQLQFADAAMRVDTAVLHAGRAADDIDRHAVAGTRPDTRTRARIRADASHAAGQIVAALDVLLDAHGSGGFAESSPLHRIWQDAHVGARHGLILPAVSLEVYGKILLGQENTISPAI